tara:strand:+ start:4074 stop:4448 length:375 start_codon:yes stop_codon:yes gene_type:complete
MNSLEKLLEITETFNRELERAKGKEEEKDDRKGMPVYSGVLTYFPDAIMEISKCSVAGQKQHNPNEPLGWDRSKSGDELDAMMRHLLEHAKGNEFDDCGTRHIVKSGWRILAFIQKTIEMQYEK